MIGISKKRAKYAGIVWRVELIRSDGLVCKWQFDNCSKQLAKGLVKGYIESCPYDCKYTIYQHH